MPKHKELVGEHRERCSGGIDVDGAVDVDRFDDACSTSRDFQLPWFGGIDDAVGSRAIGDVGARLHVSAAVSGQRTTVNFMRNRFSNSLRRGGRRLHGALTPRRNALSVCANRKQRQQ